MKIIVEGDKSKIEIVKKRFRNFNLTFTDFKEEKKEEVKTEGKPKRGRKKKDD